MIEKKSVCKFLKVLSFTVVVTLKYLFYPKHGIVNNIYEKQGLP